MGSVFPITGHEKPHTGQPNGNNIIELIEHQMRSWTRSLLDSSRVNTVHRISTVPHIKLNTFLSNLNVSQYCFYG